MAEKIAFDLVSPEQMLLATAAEMVTIPGADGDMGVMAGHMPLISTLRPGVIAVAGGEGDGKFYVAGGFAEVTSAKCIVLADEAVPLSDIDAAKLDALVKQAEADSAAGKPEVTRARAEARLEALKHLKAAQ
jgi:F-type H+-transporting ATPase subunit epsilon